MSLFDELRKMAERQNVEPETLEQSEKDFNFLREKYGDLIIRFTDKTDLLLAMVVAQGDIGDAVKISMNVAFGAFTLCYKMIRAIDPKATEELDRRDPSKFDPGNDTWQE